MLESVYSLRLVPVFHCDGGKGMAKCPSGESDVAMVRKSWTMAVDLKMLDLDARG